MTVEIFEKLPALAPLECFSLSCRMRYSQAQPSLKVLRSKFLLPDTSDWLGEESFASVAIAWSQIGLFVGAFVDKPFEEVIYPRFSQGDALELFIDTRDFKKAGFATRFCHRFVVFAKPFQGISAHEISHFRAEDSHPLCDPADLQVISDFASKSYQVQVFIPAHCLHGYDSEAFDRIGFTYRVHRLRGVAQHFAIAAHHFSLEQHPRLWASFKLVK